MNPENIFLIVDQTMQMKVLGRERM